MPTRSAGSKGESSLPPGTQKAAAPGRGPSPEKPPSGKRGGKGAFPLSTLLVFWVIVFAAFGLVTGGRFFLVVGRALLSPLGIIVTLGAGGFLLFSASSPPERPISDSATQELDSETASGEKTLQEIEAQSDHMLWEADPEFAAELGAQPPGDDQESSAPEGDV